MPVAIVPNNEVIGTGPFLLNPNPTVPLYQATPRIAPNPILYETINPTLTITVQATGGCPLPILPELITSITLVPGQGVTGNTGSGCNIIKLADIADRPVIDIPAMLSPAFVEPSITYGTITGPPSPTMALVAPLKGFYGEKYFYDAEYIYASYFSNSPALDPVDGTITPNAPITKQNRLTSVSLLEGRKILPFADLPEGLEKITTDIFPGPGFPLVLGNLAPFDPASVLTYGNDYLLELVPEISSWVKWKPSFIEIMKYNYTLIVTHTCPPFVTSFQGSMLVQNNWTPAASRLAYYIALQKGFLDLVDANS